MQRAVFLDRDDTLIANRDLPAPDPRPPDWSPGDLADPSRVRLLSGAGEACAALVRGGFVLVAITNQGCVARGSATISDVHATNQRVFQLLDGSTNSEPAFISGAGVPPASSDPSGTGVPPVAADPGGTGIPPVMAGAPDQSITLPIAPSLLRAIYFCPFHPDGRIARFAREHPWRKPAPGMILAAAQDFGIDLSASWLVGDQDRDVGAGLAAGIAPARCLLLGRDEPDLPGAAARILRS